MKKLGFTFDEKILEVMSLEAFFYDLPHFESIEIAPHQDIYPINTYKKIVTHAPSHQYHVPYFVKNSSFEFTKDGYHKAYTNLFSIIESLRQYSVKTPSMIVHGSTNLQLGLEQTRFGIDYLLNFIEQKKMDLTISLETLELNEATFGHRDDILKIVNEFDHSNLKICLDTCHDYYNFDTYKKPNEKFLNCVNYIHMHGKQINKHDSVQHFPIDVIKTLNLDVVYNLELLSQFTSDYHKTLISDLKYLQKHL